jgi:hypothetical protein
VLGVSDLSGYFPTVVEWGKEEKTGIKLCFGVRAVPAFELAILRAIFHSKGPKA